MRRYTGRGFYFVTLCCHQRRKIFIDPDRCREAAVSRSFSIHAYCVMPDHIHLLAQGPKPSSDFLNFVKAFKIKTSREFANETNEQLRQKNFYDHILRLNESAESVAWYSWLNPMRAGLAISATEFPFAGSFTKAIPGLAAVPTPWTPALPPRKVPPQKVAPTDR